MLKIGFDIGGVISKYPEIFWDIMQRFRFPMHRSCDGDWSDEIKNIFIITDQHPKDEVINLLKNNGFIYNGEHDTNFVTVLPENVYCADYEKYGNMAKAILIKELRLDIFIDDFEGYLQWDSSLGPQPILLKVQPDAFRPYWSDNWNCDGGEFGRRKYTGDSMKKEVE